MLKAVSVAQRSATAAPLIGGRGHSVSARARRRSCRRPLSASASDASSTSSSMGSSVTVKGARGVNLHAKVSGPSDAPTVILLHGFPGFHRDWRTQVPALNAANVRTIALDMRGYAQSEKPKGIENYKMELLVDDVRAAITQLCPSGYARAVVGHDWGGAVAWSFALANETSGLFERLAVLNLPHPLRFQQALQSDPSQLLKSWYIGAFQIPGVAEAALTAQDSLILRRLYTTEPRPPYTSDEVERYVKAFNTPGAAEATVNYYRAALQLGGFFSGFTESAYSVIDKPTLVLWGEDDAYLTTNMADPPTRLVPNCTVVKIPDATHWVMNDASDEVNERLVSFVTS